MGASKKFNVLGTAIQRVDSLDKVTGKAVYAADHNVTGQLFGRVKYPDYPHAKILSIDISEAKSLDGVRAVMIAEDIPGEPSFGSVVAHQMALCTDRVRFWGDAVALVAADTPELAEYAVSLIEVEYEPLEVVSDPKEALKKKSIKIHSGGNLCVHHKVSKGDIEKGFAQSDIILERDYRTQKIEHAYLEPEAVLARPGENGGVTIVGSVQNLYTIRRAVARVLGVELSRVRIEQAVLGGSFGGKDEVMGAMCCRAALLALATGRPIKIVNSREQSMRESYKRHPYRIEYKIGATESGVIKAIQSVMYADAGAYATMSPFVTWRSVVHGSGPYRIANVKTDVYAAYTNNCYTGAMRGFGSPQVCFAVESLIDELAEKLGMNPYELRIKNLIKDNSITATGQKLQHKVGIRQVLDNVIKRADYDDKWNRYRKQSPADEFKRGIGFSCSYRGVSLGAEGIDAAGVNISIQTDGSIIASTGLIEMGQGAATTISMIIAEELGVTTDHIRFLNADTSITPDSGPTVASRTTIMAGNAARNGCRELLKKLKPVAAEYLGCATGQLKLKDNIIHSDNKEMNFSELAAICFGKGIPMYTLGWYKSPKTSWDEETGKGEAYFTFVYGANLAEVEVDCVTGKVRLLNFISSHDLGRVVNLNGAKGQVYGGVAMGMGYALFETYSESDGIPKFENYDEYLIPTICDMPPVEIEFVENPDKLGPFGAKSIGEPACELAAPAIANAIYNATGRRLLELPITLEQVLIGKNLTRTESRGSSKARGED